MICLLTLVNFRRTRHLWLRLWLLLGFLFNSQAVANLQATKKPLVLPQTITRSMIVDQSQWQGISVELEHLKSPATLEVTLEQLAMALPALTPVWSEQGVVHAHWTSADSSYALFLWANDTQGTEGTEGLLSSLVVGQLEKIASNTVSTPLLALEWLPKQSAQLFSFVDQSSGSPITLSSFTVPLMASLLIPQLKAYGQRNGWLKLPDGLAFIRDSKRLSFYVMADRGSTTVFVYETTRDTQ